MMRPQTMLLITHAAMALAIVVAATVLTALHDLDAQAAVAIYGAAIGLVGGSAAALGAVNSAVNGKSVVDPGMMRAAIEQLGASTPPKPTEGAGDGN